MPDLKTEFLCDMVVTVETSYLTPQAPGGTRIVAPFSGGSFSGPKISGNVLPTGGDWMVIRPDGVMVIDVRATLQADDGSLIHVTYGGRLFVPQHLQEQALNPETAEQVDPAAYYFRSAPLFEVATDSPHAWLNSKVAIGVGKLIKGGVSYKIYTIE